MRVARPATRPRTACCPSAPACRRRASAAIASRNPSTGTPGRMPPSAAAVAAREWAGVEGTAPWLVSDELWDKVEPLLPRAQRPIGRPRLPDRSALEGILYVLHTGIPWNRLPAELGLG